MGNEGFQEEGEVTRRRRSDGGDEIQSTDTEVPKEEKKKGKKVKSEATVLQTVRNVLVVLALSLHAIFEGMAVGKFFNVSKCLLQYDILFSKRSPVDE